MTKRRRPTRNRNFHMVFMHYFEYTLWLVTGAAFVCGTIAFGKSDMSAYTSMEFCLLTAILVSEFID